MTLKVSKNEGGMVDWIGCCGLAAQFIIAEMVSGPDATGLNKNHTAFLHFWLFTEALPDRGCPIPGII